MTIFNDPYVLYCHTYLNKTNYCWKTVGMKTILDRPYICTNRVWHLVSGAQLIIRGTEHFC
jgi:hypothetical protein